jgi:hypothetical protein
MQLKIILLKRFIWVFALIAGLVSCSPAFDWRTVRSDDLYYEALYPGKPSRAENTFLIDGEKFTMTMEAAKVEGALYAVGLIQLPMDSKISPDAVLKYLKNGMSSNLKSKVPASLKVVSMRTAGQPSYELPAEELVQQGMGPDNQERLLTVQWAQRKFPDGQTMIYQVSVLQVIGKSNERQYEEEHQMFIRGFRPY